MFISVFCIQIFFRGGFRKLFALKFVFDLIEEIVLFAMFDIIDTNVPNNVQQDMAEKHFKLKPNHSTLNIPENRFGKDYGKPRFPSISEEMCPANLFGHDMIF